MGRNEIIREEAEEWRRQGRIHEDFHLWLQTQYPLGRDQGTERRLQQILLTIAGILVIVGIFTLVAEFWENFTDVQKLWILRLFAVMAIGLGAGLYFVPKLRVLTHVLLPLSIPLYLFSMEYADPGYQPGTGMQIGGNAVDPQELSSLIIGVAFMLGALLVGLRRFPSLAMGSTPGLLGVLLFLPSFVVMNQGAERGYQWLLLFIVLALHTALLLAWIGIVPIPFVWDAFSLRLALFANVPMGFFLIIQLVNEYGRDANFNELYDVELVAISLTAVYNAALLFLGLRLGMPELIGISGVFLVVDAIWLGSDKGDVIGAALAILGLAVLLGVLAQRGVLRRIFKPQAPPTSSAKIVRGSIRRA